MLLAVSVYLGMVGLAACAAPAASSAPVTPALAISASSPASSADTRTEADWWMVRLTAGAVFVAAIQGGLFLWQLTLMRRTAEDTRRAAVAAERSVETMARSARTQLRAYLCAQGATMKFPEPGKPSVTVVVKNSGATPALNVQHWIHQWVARYPLDDVLPEPPEDFVMSCDVLATNAWHTHTNTHPGMIMKPGYLHEIGTSEGTIYVYGEIRYDDVFGDPHVTRYRMMYGGDERSIGDALKPCPEGNSMT